MISSVPRISCYIYTSPPQSLSRVYFTIYCIYFLYLNSFSLDSIFILFSFLSCSSSPPSPNKWHQLIFYNIYISILRMRDIKCNYIAKQLDVTQYNSHLLALDQKTESNSLQKWNLLTSTTVAHM
jgi:hypothetical protein